MNQGVGNSSCMCLTCGGLIPEPGITYGYAGKYCYCPIDPNKVRYQRRSDEQGQSIFGTNQTGLGGLATYAYEPRIKALEDRITELEKERDRYKD